MSEDRLVRMLRAYLSAMTCLADKVTAINRLRLLLHEEGPFREEPVDCVCWVPATEIEANDYNPNVVAPAEMRLLKKSLTQDGFTQPVVAVKQGAGYTVVDGYHRFSLGKDNTVLKQRLQGYLPVVQINAGKDGIKRRIAATIRHNRARGKHEITGMSDIVRDLSRLGWNDARIGQELGMDSDEVLRLKQISGLADIFVAEEFSPAWTIR